MSKVVVIAPHPDDETLGCGGTLLRHKKCGDELFWIIVTAMSEEIGYTKQQIKKRDKEIKNVADKYGFSNVKNLDFPTAYLDNIPNKQIIDKISNFLLESESEIVYLPYRGDVHTDHTIVFDAAISSTKWFRLPPIKKIFAYETLSETEYGLDPDRNNFMPNTFVRIDDFLEEKIEIMKIYNSEIGKFPLPRSEETIRSLAFLRGSIAGCRAAEAFILLKDIIK